MNTTSTRKILSRNNLLFVLMPSLCGTAATVFLAKIAALRAPQLSTSTVADLMPTMTASQSPAASAFGGIVLAVTLAFAARHYLDGRRAMQLQPVAYIASAVSVVAVMASIWLHSTGRAGTMPLAVSFASIIVSGGLFAASFFAGQPTLDEKEAESHRLSFQLLAAAPFAVTFALGFDWCYVVGPISVLIGTAFLLTYRRKDDAPVASAPQTAASSRSGSDHRRVPALRAPKPRPQGIPSVRPPQRAAAQAATTQPSARLLFQARQRRSSTPRA